jgi:hypothetical protein
MRSLWTSKEGANSVGPLDFGSRWNRLLQSIGLKNRIDSWPHLGKGKIKTRQVREGQP